LSLSFAGTGFALMELSGCRVLSGAPRWSTSTAPLAKASWGRLFKTRRRWKILILVATLGGPTMMARIGIMRALNRHVERVFNPRS
jgi:hypothetical protein